MTTNRSVPIVVISAENIPNKIRNIDDVEYELSQSSTTLKSTPSRKSKGRSLIKYKSAPPVPTVLDQLNDSEETKENEYSRPRVISHILPRFPVRHGVLKQKSKAILSRKKILTEKTSDNRMEQENMDKILLESILSSDDNAKKTFKSNLLQLTPDDLHQTALRIQEKSFPNKASEHLMLNVLNGNEFEEWFRLLRSGFNILLHGVGSKKSLVSLFFKKYLKTNHFTVIINGFLPNITIKQVLQTLCSCPEIGINTPHRNHVDCMQEIVQRIETKKLHLYLLINNIDGMNFRNGNIQNVFQIAAHSQFVHILATIDHIHGPLIWNQQGLNSFRWIWYAVHTWLPYIDETTNERLNTARSKTSQLSITAVEHVIESLTPNARRIFRLLVEAFLSNSNSKDYEGMKLSDLYEQCKRGFYVNNEQNLRLQLIEFIDHRLVKLVKSTIDGQELVRLLIAEQDIVKQLLVKLN